MKVRGRAFARAGNRRRQWPPRDSRRASAPAATSRADASMLRSAGSAVCSSRPIVSSSLTKAFGVALQSGMAGHRGAQHMGRGGQGESFGRGRFAARRAQRDTGLDVLGHTRAEHQGLPAANWRRDDWRHEGRSRRILPPPKARAATSGPAHPRRCRPCDNARPAPPGWVVSPDRCRPPCRRHTRWGNASRISRRWLRGNPGRRDGPGRSGDEARAPPHRGAPVRHRDEPRP